MYDANGKPILSPAAILDEAEHQAFLRKCAMDLAAYKAPARPPSPRREPTISAKALEGMGRLVSKAISEATEPLVKRIAAIEQGQVHMAGTYKSGERYRQNGLVSFQGGLWLCLADTDTRPGSGSPAWRLAVKRGDAK